MKTNLSLMFLLNIIVILKTYLKAKQACSENKHRGKTERGAGSGEPEELAQPSSTGHGVGQGTKFLISLVFEASKFDFPNNQNFCSFQKSQYESEIKG